MKKLLFILLFIPLLTASNLIYSQKYVLTEHEEFKVSLPGDVYYAANRNKEGQLLYEELFADAEYSDFELDLNSIITDYQSGVLNDKEFDEHVNSFQEIINKSSIDKNARLRIEQLLKEVN